MHETAKKIVELAHALGGVEVPLTNGRDLCVDIEETAGAMQAPKVECLVLDYGDRIRESFVSNRDDLATNWIEAVLREYRKD